MFVFRHHPMGGKGGGIQTTIWYNGLMDAPDAQNLALAKPLTPREQDVLNCIGRDMTNRQIAEELIFALSTVKWYVRQIYKKLGVENREEAIDRANRLGLISMAESGGRVKHNLPVSATPFVSREPELTTLTRLIADPQVHCITLIGPGGIGKTRLALEAARRELAETGSEPNNRIIPSFPDGIYFVPLAPVDLAKGIVTTLAGTLDFRFQGSSQISRTETDQILDFLEYKQMLLVLDNFEQITDGRSFLAGISERATGIKMIVTSRERLQLHGEQLLPVKGLTTPKDETATGDSLSGNGAVQLFLNIAKRIQPDFMLRHGDELQLIRICRLVEGMPLGLELAASWVGVLPLSNIADEIEQSLHLLTADHHDLPERHRSLLATLDTSWARLNSDQKVTFQKLTIFNGGFTRMAALGVAGATLPLLVSLLNKSWLSYDSQRDRYNIHILLRQYGAAKLSRVPANDLDLHKRHSTYFCSYLEERKADWFGSRQIEAASELLGEIDNIQLAWDWASKQADVCLLSKGLDSLCQFYHREGRLFDGQNACSSAGDMLPLSLAKAEPPDPRQLALKSKLLAWQSEFVNEVTQKEKLLVQSQAILDRAASTSRDLKHEQAFTFLEKARAAAFTDVEEAIHHAELGLTMFREMGDRSSEAQALECLGVQYIFQGDYGQAKDLLQASMEIRRKMDDTYGIAETTLELAMVARHQGQFSEAERLHRSSLRLYQQLGYRFQESHCLATYAVTLIVAGKFTRSRDVVAQAIEIEHDLGQFAEPFSLGVLSRAYIHLGRYEDARALSEEFLDIASQRGLFMHVGFALLQLGSIAFIEGKYDAAKGYLLESRNVLAEHQHIYQVLPLAVMSYVIRAEGDGNLALQYLLSALRFGIGKGSITPLLYCLPAAALIVADDGRLERAIEIHTLAQSYGHIANSTWYKQVCGRELQDVLESLPPEVGSAAQDRGRALDIWTTAEKLLLELVN